jgi:hypothetical protein
VGLHFPKVPDEWVLALVRKLFVINVGWDEFLSSLFQLFIGTSTNSPYLPPYPYGARDVQKNSFVSNWFFVDQHPNLFCLRRAYEFSILDAVGTDTNLSPS